MVTVYIVCGAGASSTFLAFKLRALASDLDVKLQFLPAALESVHAKPDDLVLLAAHVANAPKVSALAEAGITVLKLPEQAVGGFNANDALAMILNVVESRQNFVSDSTTETKLGLNPQARNN